MYTSSGNKGVSPGKNKRMQSGLGRHGIRRAKAQAELNLARNVKNSMKTFYRYFGQKRQAKASVPPLVNVKELASMDEEKAEVLNKSFASVFTGGQDSSTSHVSEPLRPASLNL